MVHTTHCGDNVQKTNDILGVAQKRFGLYGLEKTTMREIAADLGMSKASLYYYYPDKESLFKAVIALEQEGFFNIVNQTWQTISSPVEMLNQYCVLRLRHFRSFFNLGRLKHEEMRQLKPLLKGILVSFRDREIQIVETLLIQGNNSGIFDVNNTNETASLFIDLLKGLRSLEFQNKELLYVEESEFKSLEQRQTLFSEIFIKGLTHK